MPPIFSLASVALAIVVLFGAGQATAEVVLESGDPIASIDGDPIYLGELNLILTERFKSRDLEKIPLPVQQATALLLVRRHLALRTLRSQGGQALESLIRRTIESHAAEATRRGSSLAQQAAARLSDEKSIQADIAWRVAWGQYLKSKMSEENLRRFFDRRKEHYGVSRFEELTDQGPLRRDAANALFETLIAAQREAKVMWLVSSLRPPDDIDRIAP